MTTHLKTSNRDERQSASFWSGGRVDRLVCSFYQQPINWPTKQKQKHFMKNLQLPVPRFNGFIPSLAAVRTEEWIPVKRR